MAQWIEHWTQNQRVASQSGHMPGLGARSPSRGCTRDKHTLIFLFLPSFPSLKIKSFLKSHHVLSKFMILCWGTFTAILGCIACGPWAAGWTSLLSNIQTKMVRGITNFHPSFSSWSSAWNYDISSWNSTFPSGACNERTYEADMIPTSSLKRVVQSAYDKWEE